MTRKNLADKRLVNLAASRHALQMVLYPTKQKKTTVTQLEKYRTVRKKTAALRSGERVKVDKSATGHLKNIQHMRAVLGALLIRRWDKQPIHIASSLVNSAIQRSIRKHPLPILGLAAAGGALFVALQVWRTKTPKKKNKSSKNTL